MTAAPTVPRRTRRCGRAAWAAAALLVLAAVGTGCAPASPTVTVPDVVGVDGGRRHACAVSADGAVRCWGTNLYGQLGDGSTTDAPDEPVAVGIPPASAVTAGADFTCALLQDARVACWGFNLSGQLGNGTDTGVSLEPVPVSGLEDAVTVSAGGEHACALRDDGSVWCWGQNDVGQLGDGTTTSRDEPVRVTGVVGAVGITAGRSHSCAAVDDGTVRCWGGGTLGQLGDGGREDSPEPVRVSMPGTAVGSVDAGTESTCAAVGGAEDPGRSVWCWGANESGQLGVDGDEDRPVPVEVPDLDGPRGVVLGERWSCAVLADGSARCWGGGAADDRVVVDTAAAPPSDPGEGGDPGPDVRRAPYSFLGNELCRITGPDEVTCAEP